MEDLKFNYNCADITPEEQVLLWGYANRKGLSGKVHRRLSSRCVVLKQGDITVCLIVNDLMDADPVIIQMITDQISGQAGIDRDSILILSTHTHSAPEMEFGKLEANDRYIKMVVQRITENACKTIMDHSGFRKATMKYGRAICDINIARRDVKPEEGGKSYRIGDPDGLRDEEVGILQLSDKDNIRIVTFFNYACHPVTLGFESLFVSTDYPGKSREVAEQFYGGMAVFLNGAAGDLNPRDAHHTDPAITDGVGERLGMAIISESLTEFTGPIDLKEKTKTIRLPFRDQNITKEHIASEVKRKAEDVTEFFNWKEMLENWQLKIGQLIDGNRLEDSFPIKINVLKLGKVIIFFTQGELFVKYQLELKRRFPEYQVFCVSYVHGVGTYIPTEDVFEAKGYETDQAYIYEQHPSPLSDQVEKIYLEAATDLINELTWKK
jgi:hypothetical protein